MSGFACLADHAPKVINCATGECSLAPPKMAQSQTPVKLSILIRGIPATLRQALLGKEIEFTFADAAAINQPPQSGTHGQFLAQFNPWHDCYTIIRTDWNRRLKHTRWKAAGATKNNA